MSGSPANSLFYLGVSYVAIYKIHRAEYDDTSIGYK